MLTSALLALIPQVHAAPCDQMAGKELKACLLANYDYAGQIESVCLAQEEGYYRWKCRKDEYAKHNVLINPPILRNGPPEPTPTPSAPPAPPPVPAPAPVSFSAFDFDINTMYLRSVRVEVLSLLVAPGVGGVTWDPGGRLDPEAGNAAMAVGSKLGQWGVIIGGATKVFVEFNNAFLSGQPAPDTYGTVELYAQSELLASKAIPRTADSYSPSYADLSLNALIGPGVRLKFRLSDSDEPVDPDDHIGSVEIGAGQMYEALLAEAPVSFSASSQTNGQILAVTLRVVPVAGLGAMGPPNFNAISSMNGVWTTCDSPSPVRITINVPGGSDAFNQLLSNAGGRVVVFDDGSVHGAAELVYPDGPSLLVKVPGMFNDLIRLQMESGKISIRDPKHPAEASFGCRL